MQLPSKQPIYVRHYFDFSLYVHADPVLIQQWYHTRFGILLDTAFTDPSNYYYQYALGNRAQHFALARQVWTHVNLKLLKTYILPTKLRADVLYTKTKDSKIHQVSYN